MSGRVLEWVIKLRTPLSHAEARVLMVLASHAGHDGSDIFPTVETIEAMAQANRRTVIRSLARLEEIGLITRQKGGGRAKSSQYAINLAFQDIPQTVAPRHPLTRKTVVSRHPKAALNGGTTPPIRTLNSGMVSVNSGVMPPDSVQTQSKQERAPPIIPPTPADDSAPRAASPTRRAAAKGMRLPEDWQPSEDDRKFAEKLELDPIEAAAEFRDYWHAVPGGKGCKLDWSATWRNRCRDRAAREKRFARPQRRDPAIQMAEQRHALHRTERERESFDREVRELRYGPS